MNRREQSKYFCFKSLIGFNVPSHAQLPKHAEFLTAGTDMLFEKIKLLVLIDDYMFPNG